MEEKQPTNTIEAGGKLLEPNIAETIPDVQTTKYLIEQCSASHKTMQGLVESSPDLNDIKDELKLLLNTQGVYLSTLLKNIDINTPTSTGKSSTNLQPKSISPSFFRRQLTIKDLGIPPDGAYYTKVVGLKHFDNTTRFYIIELAELVTSLGFGKNKDVTQTPII
jgi:hypothetical protein